MHEARESPDKGDVPVPDRPPRSFASLGGALVDWLKSITVALALFFVVRSIGVEAFKIPTSSMEEHAAGRRLPDRQQGGRTELEIPGVGLTHSGVCRTRERGDVIVFNPPSRSRPRTTSSG